MGILLLKLSRRLSIFNRWLRVLWHSSRWVQTLPSANSRFISKGWLANSISLYLLVGFYRGLGACLLLICIFKPSCTWWKTALAHFDFLIFSFKWSFVHLLAWYFASLIYFWAWARHHINCHLTTSRHLLCASWCDLRSHLLPTFRCSLSLRLFIILNRILFI